MVWRPPMADQNFFPVPRWCLFSSTSSTSGALVPRSFFCTMKVAMSAAFTNNKKHMYTLLQNHYIIINIGDVWKNDRFVSKFDSRISQSYLGLFDDVGELSHPLDDLVWSDQDVAVAAVNGRGGRLHQPHLDFTATFDVDQHQVLVGVQTGGHS